MFFALSLVLSTLIFPVACQSVSIDNGFNSGFHPDGPTTGLFAILCIFGLVYGVLSIWNFVALLVARGHRAPHALLLPTIVLWGWSNAVFMAAIVLNNIADLEFDDFTFPALDFADNLTNDWGSLLFFLAIIAVLWNREAALQRATTDGKAGNGGHHPVLIALHVLLAALLFIFGTAAPAMALDAYVKFYNTDFEFTFSNLEAEALDHRLNIANNLYYTFDAFVVLTCVDITATTVVLWRGWKKAGVSDKITNTMLYVVVPLYCIMSLLIMIFTILSGLPQTDSLSTFESVSLADNLLVGGLSLVIAGIILVAGVKKAWWGTSGDAPVQQQWSGAQPQYSYATPQYGQVPQAGYYPAQPGQIQQEYPMQVQQQYVPQEQYAPAVQGGYTPHHAEGHMSYASSTPPPTTSVVETSVGGYTPSPPPQGLFQNEQTSVGGTSVGGYNPSPPLQGPFQNEKTVVETSVGGYNPSPPPQGPYQENEKIGLHF